MTIAEIRGKVSETGTNLSERMEDLLTSDTFGCMRYLPASKVLIPFLRCARSLHGKEPLIPIRLKKLYFLFWPWLRIPTCHPCEPDVIICMETKNRHISTVLKKLLGKAYSYF